jgi:hypothetical protein
MASGLGAYPLGINCVEDWLPRRDRLGNISRHGLDGPRGTTLVAAGYQPVSRLHVGRNEYLLLGELALDVGDLADCQHHR